MVSLLTPFRMASDWKILEQMRRERAIRRSVQGLRGALRPGPPIRFKPHHFQDIVAGDPRVNIQNDRGRAKAWQVRQVLDAIDRLKEQKS
jgi:hypothetical protein